MDKAAEVVDFWFGRAGDPDYGQYREAWFKRDDAFDAAIRAGFLDLCEAALAGGLAEWRRAPRSCLALVILLDQFPRNLFRGSPRAFAGDRLAIDTAKHAIDRCFDRGLPPVMRGFLYLPFEHSESLAEQDRSVALFGTLATPLLLDYAVRHRDVVARFGRFPHRNAVLGRQDTPEEAVFLTQPGSSF